MSDVGSIQAAIAKLETKVKSVKLPDGLIEKIDEEISQLKINVHSEATFWENYQRLGKYIDWVIAIPWFDESKDILDVNYAQEVLDKSHYGLQMLKDRILEYISVLALQRARTPDKKIRAPIMLFVGLVGTGKTTISKTIAEAMGRQFVRIPFGGLGDPLYLRGRSRIYPEAEPGILMRQLATVKTRNPVILLDEIDRVADDVLNTIMGVLVELLDPEQNDRFTDHYIDYPFDLSQAIFCATCNNTARIATAVMDRLEVLQMPSYTDEEKMMIGKKYLLPRALIDAGLSGDEIAISDTVWPQVVRPLGFDAGVRTLKRNIEAMTRRVALLILQGQIKNLTIDENNVKKFLPQW